MQKSSGIFVFIFFSIFVGSTNACGCQRLDILSTYCIADYVIKVDVTGEVLCPSSLAVAAYKIKVLETFKMTYAANHALQAGLVEIRTVHDRCRLNLQLGTSYLLAGKLQSGQPIIDVCIFAKPWSQVTPTELLGLKGHYADQCMCTPTHNKKAYTYQRSA